MARTRLLLFSRLQSQDWHERREKFNWTKYDLESVGTLEFDAERRGICSFPLTFYGRIPSTNRYL